MKSPKGFLITGASAGIGREIALALAIRQPCSHLYLVGRSNEALEETAQMVRLNTGCQATVAVLDLERITTGDATALAERMQRECEVIAGVVHNAGLFVFSDVAGGQHADVAQQVVGVNLLAPMLLDAALVPLMSREGRSALLYVNSTAGIEHRPGNEAYSGSKAGLLAYANALRESLRKHRISVINACPGPTWTRSWAGMDQHQSRMMAASGVGDELARQLVTAIEGGMVCEQINLRHVSGAI